MESILTKLRRKDRSAFFEVPVDGRIVTDYYKIITQPMSFSTMQSKLNEGLYTDFDTFDHDVNLIISNCRMYNAHDTPYCKQAEAILVWWDKVKSNFKAQFYDLPGSTPTEQSTVKVNDISMRIPPNVSTQPKSTVSPSTFALSDFGHFTQRKDMTLDSQREKRSIVSSRKTTPRKRKLDTRPTLSQRSKNLKMDEKETMGPTLSTLLISDGDRRAGLERLRQRIAPFAVERSDCFFGLMRHLIHSSMLKLVCGEQTEIPERYPPQSYKASLLNFVGEANLQALNPLIHLEEAVERLDPSPSIPCAPFNDLRLFGIDTADFMALNKNLQVDKACHLGVGENHTKTALSLVHDNPTLSSLGVVQFVHQKYSDPSTSHTNPL